MDLCDPQISRGDHDCYKNMFKTSFQLTQLLAPRQAGTRQADTAAPPCTATPWDYKAFLYRDLVCATLFAMPGQSSPGLRGQHSSFPRLGALLDAAAEGPRAERSRAWWGVRQTPSVATQS